MRVVTAPSAAHGPMGSLALGRSGALSLWRHRAVPWPPRARLGEPELREQRLVAGYLCALQLALGLLMLLAPSPFEGRAYADIRPHLGISSLALLASGALALLVATELLPRRALFAAALAATVPLGSLALGTLLADAAGGVVYATAAAAALVLGARALGLRALPGGLPYWIAGVVQLGQVGIILTTPDQHAVREIYGDLSRLLPLYGPSALAGGAGLIWSELRGRHAARNAFAALSVLNLSLYASLLVGARLWPAALSVAMPAALLVFASARPDRRRVSVLCAAFAVGVAATDSLGSLFAGLGWLVELDPRRVAPEVAAGLALTAASFFATVYPWKRAALPAGAATAGALGLGVVHLALGETQPALPAAYAAIPDGGLLVLSAVAVALLRCRPCGRWSAHLAALLAGLIVASALPSILEYLAAPTIVYSLSAVDVWAGVAFTSFAAALLLASVPDIARGPVGGRIFLGFALLLMLSVIRGHTLGTGAAAAVALAERDPFAAAGLVSLAQAVGSGLLLLMLVVAAGSTVLISRTVTGPLEALRAAVRHTATREGGVRSAIRRDDEIGTVADAIDEMAGALVSSETAVRALNAQLERQLAVAERRRAEVEALAESARVVAEGPARGTTLDAILREALRVVPSHAALLLRPTADPSVLEVAATAGPAPDVSRLRLAGSIVGRAVRSRAIEIVRDVRTDPDYVEWIPSVRSMLCVPILDRGGAVLAVLDLEADEVGRYGEADAALMRAFGADVAIALENERLLAELRHEREAVRALNADLEERVAHRTAELVAATAELEAFSYSVSHDLRAPLRSIDGFSQALLEDHGPTLEPQAREYLGLVRESAQEMAQLIDDLLRLSLVTRGEMERERLDLSAMVRDVLDALAKRDPDRAITIRIQEGIAADGDARLLRAGLENLLQNAWKFTARRSDAAIEFGVLDQRPPVYFVRDNGVGFDMSDEHRLFRPFQRLRGSEGFDGSGIGLATVERVLRRHGGEIWARSARGEGATFFFTLGPSGPAS